MTENNSSTSSKRVVLTYKLIDYLATNYEQTLPYFLNKYEHEAHTFGIDLCGDIEEDDIILLSAYMDVYFSEANHKLDGYEL